MAKLTKTAKGLSDQLAPVLEGTLDAIYRVTDAHKARQIKNQLQLVVRLAVKASEAGLTKEQFRSFLTMFITEQALVAGGRMEFAAAVASGIETAEGKEFSVTLGVQGAIAGFGITAEGGFTSDSRESSYERSSQNLRIRLDWTSVPMQQFDKLVDSIAARVFEQGSVVSEPVLTDEERSPILEALESYLPIIKEVFNTEDND